eukprot:CAMPEP_0182833426 /NCGR_PEP_ID=MMETSP0006_2-20121128/20290_1 /TAXON_ID=97485 /ORGANISM="Prymnesium parvum, Strain Texoma1" /LENGTH=123 /DNA_ID=CAMNT_0024961435 /DNA_START=80 /DNA_END=447 /DNA_ORIENTATION=+
MSGLLGGMDPEREAALRRGLSIGKDDIACARELDMRCDEVEPNWPRHDRRAKPGPSTRDETIRRFGPEACHRCTRARLERLSEVPRRLRSSEWHDDVVCVWISGVENDNVESREGARGAGGGT